MEVITHPTPRTVDEVFTDFRGRRAGLIKALTTGELCPLLVYVCFVRFGHVLISPTSLYKDDELVQICRFGLCGKQ